MNEKTYLAIFFRLRIHPKIIYVTECALGCNLIGHCLAIVVFYWVRGSIRRSQQGEGDKTPFPTKVPTHEAVPLR